MRSTKCPLKTSLLLFFLSFSALSDSYDGWSDPNTIASIRVYSVNQVLVTMSSAANPGNCDDTSYLSLYNPDSESGKRAYSALLTAYAAGKKVNLALAGCTGGGTHGWPIIQQVWLQ
ncbi:hypothetical protein [Gallaecimonas xiamenensis]|uniref:hypothetical protein n=1 Tax=Gallaecimonas xiamenensis TaxID=1207039 RepID=UPI0012EA2661|nr:hypothetical protein [Gallaecimonas xiamenensis]